MRTTTPVAAVLILVSVLALSACGSSTTTEVGGGDPATTTTGPPTAATNGLTCPDFSAMSVDYSSASGAATLQEALTNFLATAGKSAEPPLPVDGYTPEAVGPPPATVGAPETVLMVHSTGGQPDVSLSVVNYGQGWLADTMYACGNEHYGGDPTVTAP